MSTSTSSLQNKHAAIFGASGSIGTAVAKEFAAQGATVFLSGRRLAAIEYLAADLSPKGVRVVGLRPGASPVRL